MFRPTERLQHHAVLAVVDAHSTSALSRNRSARFATAPAGSLSPRSHRASVLASTPSCFAACFCGSPMPVLPRTSRTAHPVPGGKGLPKELNDRWHVLQAGLRNVGFPVVNAGGVHGELFSD